MKKVLVTGSSGFIGRNIIDILKDNKDHEIVTPLRGELDLKNEAEVYDYLRAGQFDTVLQLANPNPVKNELDQQETMFEDSLRIFMNFFTHADLFGKMIYIGSGAEYDKTGDISLVREEECGKRIPKDHYGLAKIIMNDLAERSENIYNFRIFGCFGPGDHETKFITHCIRSVLLGKPVTIRQDCAFDYIHVYDLARFLDWGIDAELRFHSYNVSTASPVYLTEIASMVCEKMGFPYPPSVLTEGYNRSYTADNSRILEESGMSIAYPISKGIDMQIAWEKENWSDKVRFDGV